MVMANVITSCRIIFSIAMLFFPVFSPGFYGSYLAAGFTDMIDGTIARKLGSESEFGAKLDTVADIILVAVAAYKLMPAMIISRMIWIWIAMIAIIKVTNIILGFIVQKQFLSVHTMMNKVTGFMLFILPLTISVVDLKYSAIAVCTVATLAAVQEGYIIKTGKNR